jgi:hypothetical protein
MDVIIDFELASQEWRKNKIHLRNGYFTYRCNYIHSNKKQCRKLVSSQKIQSEYIIKTNVVKKECLCAYEFCLQHKIRGPIQKMILQRKI